MIKVLKFGGTSVGSAKNMKRVANIVQQENATLVVLSAMSGTTDALIRIADFARSGNRAQADQHIEVLDAKYQECVEALLSGELASKAKALLLSAKAKIRGAVGDYVPFVSERLILAQGELTTSAIFSMYLNTIGVKAELLHAPNFMVTDEDAKVDQGLLKEKLQDLISDSGKMYITQGFISTNNKGHLDNLGRGGSDYSAALMGVAIDADEVQIWTDIDGMHNNDPRYVENTYPIRQMSFDEAAELAYFGAKILHPSTIQPCKEHGISVLLKNTMDPNAPGTRITDSDDEQEGHYFHAVAAKDGITVIRIYSARMLMAYGFLRKVFEIFEQHRTPIDMITTSEVSVSLTVDNDTNLDKIVADLEALGTIEIERNNTIVCIVGRMEHGDAGLAASIFASIKNVPLKMISYGASHRSMATLISTEYKKETLQALNDSLFANNK